jgi:hypothetical protein
MGCGNESRWEELKLRPAGNAISTFLEGCEAPYGKWLEKDGQTGQREFFVFCGIRLTIAKFLFFLTFRMIQKDVSPCQ